MIFTEDMKDLIRIFKRKKVDYMLVGGFAVNYYGYVRTTQDIDILVFPSPVNAGKTAKALQEFGFGNKGVSKELFETEGTAIHLGLEPNRIDILTGLKGISNSDIFRNKKVIKYKGLILNVISLNDLLRCKRSSKRLKDLADAEELEKISRKQK